LPSYLGVAAGLGAARLNPAQRATFADSSELQGTLLAAIVIVALGVVDDFRTLSVPAKVAGQILAAGVLILNGVQLLFVYFPSQGVISVGSDLAVPLTVIWVLVMVNAVNLIDGLDGLAAGITAIGAAGFFVYAYVGPSTFGAPVVTAAVLSVIVVGVGVGFLPWNFHPAWIFMGDSGSMLLGLLLASATISGVGHATLAPSGGDLAAFFIPILPLMILAVPMVDVWHGHRSPAPPGPADLRPGQGAPPPPVAGSRPHPPPGRRAHVLLERALGRHRARRHVHQRPARGGGDRRHRVFPDRGDVRPGPGPGTASQAGRGADSGRCGGEPAGVVRA